MINKLQINEIKKMNYNANNLINHLSINIENIKSYKNSILFFCVSVINIEKNSYNSDFYKL